jgi:NADH-quinone oxidoreductase subunit E
MFNLAPVGRYHVQLCGTVPCHNKGALELKEVLQRRIGDQNHVTPDGAFSWVEVECLGACCNAPMAQINADYYEDLSPEILDKLLDDLAAGRPVKPGSQIGRRSSEPQDGVKTLTDPALFDGSLLGTWRKRFDEEPVKPAPVPDRAAAEAASAAPSAAAAPKPAKPDAGRATERPVADAPAQRAANGEAPVKPGERKAAAKSERATAAKPRTRAEKQPAPQSSKSYTATPGKPEDGRPVADAKGTTPQAGTPPSKAETRRSGEEAKPIGADPTDKAPPTVPPKKG